MKKTIDLKDKIGYKIIEGTLQGVGIAFDPIWTELSNNPVTKNPMVEVASRVTVALNFLGNLDEALKTRTALEASKYALIKTTVEYALNIGLYAITGFAGLALTTIGQYADSVIPKLESYIKNGPSIFSRGYSPGVGLPECMLLIAKLSQVMDEGKDYVGTTLIDALDSVDLDAGLPGPIDYALKIKKGSQLTYEAIQYIVTTITCHVKDNLETFDEIFKDLNSDLLPERIYKDLLKDPNSGNLYIYPKDLPLKVDDMVLAPPPPLPDTSKVTIGGTAINDGVKAYVVVPVDNGSSCRAEIVMTGASTAVTFGVSVPLETALAAISSTVIPLAIFAATGCLVVSAIKLWDIQKKYEFHKPRYMNPEEIKKATTPYGNSFSMLPIDLQDEVIGKLNDSFRKRMDVANDDARLIRCTKSLETIIGKFPLVKWYIIKPELEKARGIKEKNRDYESEAVQYEREAKEIILKYWEEQENLEVDEQESAHIEDDKDYTEQVYTTIVIDEDRSEKYWVRHILKKTKECLHSVEDGVFFSRFSPLIRVYSEPDGILAQKCKDLAAAEIISKILALNNKNILQKVYLYKQLLILVLDPVILTKYEIALKELFEYRISFLLIEKPITLLTKKSAVTKKLSLADCSFSVRSNNFIKLIRLSQISDESPIDYDNAEKFIRVLLIEHSDKLGQEEKITCLIAHGRINCLLGQKECAKKDFYSAFCLNPDNFYSLKPLLALFCDEHKLIKKKNILTLKLNGIYNSLYSYVQTKKYMSSLPVVEDMEVFYVFSTRYKSSSSESFNKLAVVCEKIYQEVSSFVEKDTKKRQEQYPSQIKSFVKKKNIPKVVMKKQTFGYSVPHGAWTSLSSATTNALKTAVGDYKKNRFNGADIDNPNWPFPQDGSICWEGNPQINASGARLKYTEGVQDRKWMEEKDQKYLVRLKREKEMIKKQLQLLQLREYILSGKIEESVKTKREGKTPKSSFRYGSLMSQGGSTKNERLKGMDSGILGRKILGVLYSDDMILKVFDNHGGRKQLSYYYKGREDRRARIVDSLFGTNRRSMVLDGRDAGILVHRRGSNSYELYVNQEGRTVSVCGAVDHSKGRVPNENAITRNVHLALSQILYWQQTERVAIRSHTIPFSYHVKDLHWCLGELQLGFNEDKTLARVSIRTYNTLSLGGYEASKEVRGEIESEINTIFGTRARVVLTSIRNEEQKSKQGDGSSCGVFTSEYGKDVIDGVNTRRQQTVPRGTLPWRQQHIDDIDDERFTELAETAEEDVPRISAPKLPNNIHNLVRELFEGISSIEDTEEQKLMQDWLLILSSVRFESREVALHYNPLRNIFMRHINIFKDICSAVVEQGSNRYTEQGQDILNELIDEYGRYVQCSNDVEEIEEDGEYDSDVIGVTVKKPTMINLQQTLSSIKDNEAQAIVLSKRMAYDFSKGKHETLQISDAVIKSNGTFNIFPLRDDNILIHFTETGVVRNGIAPHAKSEAKIFNCSSGKTIRTFSILEDTYTGISAVNNKVAIGTSSYLPSAYSTSGRRYYLCCWDLDSGKLLKKYQLTHGPNIICPLSDSIVAIGIYNPTGHTIVIYDWIQGKIIAQLVHATSTFWTGNGHRNYNPRLSSLSKLSGDMFVCISNNSGGGMLMSFWNAKTFKKIKTIDKYKSDNNFDPHCGGSPGTRTIIVPFLEDKFIIKTSWQISLWSSKTFECEKVIQQRSTSASQDKRINLKAGMCLLPGGYLAYVHHTRPHFVRDHDYPDMLQIIDGFTYEKLTELSVPFSSVHHHEGYNSSYSRNLVMLPYGDLVSLNYSNEIHVIKLPRRLINTTEINQILDKLQTNTSVTNLDLRELQLDQSNITALYKLLMANKTLVSIDLRNTGLTNENVQPILRAIKSREKVVRTKIKLDRGVGTTNRFKVKHPITNISKEIKKTVITLKRQSYGLSGNKQFMPRCYYAQSGRNSSKN